MEQEKIIIIREGIEYDDTQISLKKEKSTPTGGGGSEKSEADE